MKKIIIGSTASVVVFVAGLILRLKAVALAWPQEWSYEGARENTSWAKTEGAYVHVSLLLMFVGALMLAAVFSRWLFVDRKEIRKGKWEEAAARQSLPGGDTGES